MKKAFLLWLGLLLLLLHITFEGFLAYPAYLPFPTPAPETVSMVIDHAIGEYVRFDVFPDTVGFLLLLLVTGNLRREKASDRTPGEKKSQDKAEKYTPRAFSFGIAALCLHMANWWMPFFLNGEARYSVGYFLYLGSALSRCVAIIYGGLVLCRMAECMENHAWNNVTAIFLILASATGCIRDLCFFYELTKTSRVYLGAQLFFTLLFSWMFWKHRSFLGGDGSPDKKSAPAGQESASAGNSVKKITSRQAVALGGVILLVLLYVATLVVAIVDSSASMRLFAVCLFATMAVPLLIWLYTWMYGFLTGKKTFANPGTLPDDDGKESGSPDADSTGD